MTDWIKLVFGKSWTGKTARMLHELRECPRVVLVDGKCGQLTRLKGWSHLWSGYALRSDAWVSSEIQDFFRPLAYPSVDPFRCVIHFRNSHQEQLELLCLLLLAVKNLVLAVDELSLFIPPGPMPVLGQARTSLIVSGSHDGIAFLGTAQRPTGVHKTPISQASRMLIYRISEANDLNLLSDYLSPELLAALPSLANYICVDWSEAGRRFIDADLAGKLAHVLPETRL